MADLSKLRAHGPSNQTGELTHERDVIPLAERFLPLIRFHHDERFHPVGLEGLALIPRQEFRAASPAAAEAMEISVDVADPSGVGVVSRRFPPPVLRTNTSGSPGNVVANDQDDGLAPFARPEIGRSSKLTHGPGFTRSNRIFGSLQTVSGLEEPSEGDPRSPRHPIEVIAEFRMMWEALRHALEIENLPDDEYPKDDDSIWDMTSLVSLFFELTVSQDDAVAFTESAKRDVLAAIIAGAAPPALPFGWQLRNDVVETARNAAILEYHLIYPYNDYDRYEPWPANYHEGDDEGCCYVFDRRELERPILEGVPDGIFDVVPKHVISSVHKERQEADRIKDFDPISQNEVFVARGSHATYLTPGSHDFLSFGNAFEEGMRIPPKWLAFLSIGSIPFLLGLAVAIGEHFRDSNDETDETGIAAGSEETTAPNVVDDDRFMPVRLSVTPLSAAENIYLPSNQATTEQDGLLGLASFAGSIGAHTKSRGRTSPKYKRKTDRFFRKLIRSGRRIS